MGLTLSCPAFEDFQNKNAKTHVALRRKFSAAVRVCRPGRSVKRHGKSSSL